MKETKTILLADVGNTRVKWAVADARRLLRTWDEPTAALRARGGAPCRIPGGHRPEEAMVSCVTPPTRRALAGRLKRMGVRRTLWVSAELDLGFSFRYPKPSQVGTDRLAGAAAAVALYGAPCLVVDMGTAVSFSAVDRHGAFVGGAIAPGLNLMLSALHEHTAQLPECRPGRTKRAIGKSTLEAMQIGGWLGCRGLIREIVSAIRRELTSRCGGAHCTVVATGGACRWLVDDLLEIDVVNPRLTLEGLRILYWRNAV
ncbi:MAG: type III pantothenate kinase [Verrucomicrobiae bacterium]|nr:type III pantothenate kinase [Verrucomicrobiae bacterium]